MKVLHVIGGISRETGGPSRSCQGLVTAECNAGIDAWLWPINGGEPWVEGVRCLEVRRFGSLGEALKQFELVHIHGIWSWKLHRVAVMCRKAGVPYVLAPRGTLAPWALKYKWLKKKIARIVYQDKDLRLAAALHATAESEAVQFRALGFKNPIIVSPNGVNVPEGEVERKGGGGQQRVLFMSRMHPVKGVLELVESWARLKQSNKPNNRTVEQWSCELVYTMNSDEERAYEQKVKQRVHELGLDDQFVFTGPLDDDAKWFAYARADLFVLPTYSENFGIVVAEALWAGVPVITTKGTPWAELECSASSKFQVSSSRLEERCGWWIDLPGEVERRCGQWTALDSALREAIEQSFNPNNRTILSDMGQRGHQLIGEKYTWSAAVRTLASEYGTIISKEGR